MITASHNPYQYNGYKVYGADGCNITTEAAETILDHINAIDVFTDVNKIDIELAIEQEMVQYIPNAVMDEFVAAVESQSVLFENKENKNIEIVYSPLNGTGLVPVTRVLEKSGYTNITVVSEQQDPDGHFPTCLYPNPEVRDAMELGLKYAAAVNADILLATDPDADRCGIAVRDRIGYKLLSGNEVGILLLDFICSHRIKYNRMPENPQFIKTIITTDMAERIAIRYGLQTINVLTGFKFIGEIIGKMKDVNDYIFGFEEFYRYLTGTYVRDKDAVDAAYMICEMFAYYKSHNISLLDKLDELYEIYGYCLNSLHSYEFPGITGKEKMMEIMGTFHKGLTEIAGMKVEKKEDYSQGINGLPPSNVLKYFTHNCSLVIRPFGTEPKLKTYYMITANDKPSAEAIEKKIV